MDCEMKKGKQQLEAIVPDAARHLSCKPMLTKPLQLVFSVDFHFLVSSLDGGFHSRCLSCRLNFPFCRANSYLHHILSDCEQSKKSGVASAMLQRRYL